MQWTAQKQYVSANRSPVRQPGNGLGRHRVEHRSGDVLVGGTLVQQGLNIGFGENPAARSDGIKRGGVGSQGIHPRRVSFQQGGHLVDKRPGSSRATAVHALFRSGVQVGEFRVFAAQLDNHVGLRVKHSHRLSFRNHFLSKVHLHGFGDGQPARTGDGGGNSDFAEVRGDVFQQV